MAAKKSQSLDGLTIIELFSLSKDLKRRFRKSHAERILNHSSGDWQLVDKKYSFENGIITRSSKGDTQISEESKSDKQGN